MSQKMKYLTSTTISPTLEKKELVGVGFFCLFVFNLFFLLLALWFLDAWIMQN